MRRIAGWNTARDVWETDQVDVISQRSDVYSETFPISGMTVDGVAYELPRSAPLMAASGSLFSQLGGKLLPSPVAQPSGNSPDDHLRKKPGREVVTDLAIIGENGLLETGGKLLPTPRSNEANGIGRHGDGGDDLRTTVSLLPTPQAHDHVQGKTTEQVQAMRERTGAGVENLNEVAVNELLPTPKAGDADFGMPRTSGRPPEKSTHLMTRLMYTLPVGPDLCTACGHDDLVHDADGFCASCSPSDCRDFAGSQALLSTPRATRGGSSAEIAYGFGGERSDDYREQGNVVLPEGAQWGPYVAAIKRWEAVLGRPAPDPTEEGPKGGRRLSAVFVEFMMGLPEGWVTDPALGLSRTQQLKMLGNGVVTQQAVAALESMTVRSISEPEYG